MRPPLPLRLASFLVPFALAALLTGCAEGLSNAPAINRQWTQQDFEHDVISNGPESCPREGKDPLQPNGPRRQTCPEAPDAKPGNVPASP